MKIRPICEISGDASRSTGADARVPNVPAHTSQIGVQLAVGTRDPRRIIVCVCVCVCVWTVNEGRGRRTVVDLAQI